MTKSDDKLERALEAAADNARSQGAQAHGVEIMSREKLRTIKGPTAPQDVLWDVLYNKSFYIVLKESTNEQIGWEGFL